jgi:hypothetical protein
MLLWIPGVVDRHEACAAFALHVLYLQGCVGAFLFFSRVLVSQTAQHISIFGVRVPRDIESRNDQGRSSDIVT